MRKCCTCLRRLAASQRPLSKGEGQSWPNFPEREDRARIIVFAACLPEWCDLIHWETPTHIDDVIYGQSPIFDCQNIRTHRIHEFKNKTVTDNTFGILEESKTF
jgi:hypothetical protein